MSTEDDRPRSAGGYPDSGTSTTGGEDYSGAHRASGSPAAGQFDDAGFTTATTTSALDEPAEPVQRSRPPIVWHAGADLGLLLLRVVLGGVFLAHGAQKLFGAFNGPGIDGFAGFLGQSGFTQPTLLAWVTGISELVGGGLLVVGLFTPLGAAVVVGVMANAIYVKHTMGFFAPGFEYEVVLAAVGLALLFTGPGRIAIDRATPWARKPIPFGLVALVLAAGLSVVTLVVLR